MAVCHGRRDAQREPEKGMNYAEIEKLSDAECFQLANDSKLRIAKLCFNHGDHAVFRLIELHPTRQFTVGSARQWLFGESVSNADRRVNESCSGSSPALDHSP